MNPNKSGKRVAPATVTSSPPVVTPLSITRVEARKRPQPLTYERLRELASRHHPPQSWYEEDMTPQHFR